MRNRSGGLMSSPKLSMLGAGLVTVWLVLAVALDVATRSSTVALVPFFPFAALIASAVLPARATAVIAAVVVVAALGAGWWDHTWRDAPDQQQVRVVHAVLVGAAAVAIAAVRVRREREHVRVVKAAEIAQRAILPNMPTRVASVAVAARYVSASEEALVGGDLYDYCGDGARTRFLVGDVRGKGLDATEQAARVIRAHRQFAASGVDLTQVARSISAYLLPYLDQEEFVTAMLVDASDPASLELVSCGHPPPMLLDAHGDARLPDLPAGLPLGLGRDYASVRVEWRPGDKLLLYTDGLSEARDAAGDFLMPTALAGTLRTRDLGGALEGTLDAVRRHAKGGHLADDLALVLLENVAVADLPVSEPPQSSLADAWLENRASMVPPDGAGDAKRRPPPAAPAKSAP